jgi:hypothetical protein
MVTQLSCWTILNECVSVCVYMCVCMCVWGGGEVGRGLCTGKRVVQFKNVESILF